MITIYKRTIWYANVCSSMYDHIIKFKVLNKFLVLKEQDYEHTIQHLNFERSWSFGPDFEGLRLWRTQTLKDSNFEDLDSEQVKPLKNSDSEGSSALEDSNQFCHLLKKGLWVSLVQFVFFWPHAKTNKELEGQLEWNK